MPRPKSLKPAYCLDRSSGRAFVTLNGHRQYLGEHGTQASRDKYDAVIGEWIAQGRVVAPAPTITSVTVSTIAAGFFKHALSYYSRDSKPGSEVATFKQALKPLRRLYGATPATEFGPLALQVVREEMINSGWSRNYINAQCNRLRAVFKWAVSKELIPSNVYEALRTVDGLRAGRCGAKESERVRPVSDETVNATLPHLSPIVAAMVKLQAIIGARPTEICIMRVRDIDRSSTPWKYRPTTHKTAHHGHDRVIDLGPAARQIIAPFLLRPDDAYLFSPVEAEAQRLADLHARRRTPLSCGNRPGKRSGGLAQKPRRTCGKCYTKDSYGKAIARACHSAFPPPAPLAKLADETREQWRTRLTKEQHAELLAWRRSHRWHPHQLRHSTATKWRARYGADVTLTMLGDRTTRMIDIYAERDRAKAAEIMEKVG